MKKEKNKDFNFIGFLKELAGFNDSENTEPEIDENTDLDIRAIINQSDLSETDINYLIKGIDDIDKLASKTTAGKEEKTKNKRRNPTNQLKENSKSPSIKHEKEIDEGDRIA